MRLKELLKCFNEIEIIGVSTCVNDAVYQIIKLRPDLVFVDMEIGGESGFNILEKILEAGVKSRFIIVSAFQHYAIEALRYKVEDYLLKPINITDLGKALERVMGHRESELHHSNFNPVIPLSARENSVLTYLFEGKTSEDIGLEMNLSKHTIDTYRRNILKKLEVKNTLELLRISAR